MIFLIFPYLIWWRSFRGFDVSGFNSIFGKAFLQAILSASGSLLLGSIFFLGLTAFQSRTWRAFAELALLAPNLLPSLFLILSLFVWIFPLGLPAVIGAHIFINAGLVAISFDHLAMVRLSGMAETAWVLGASRSRFIWRVALREVRADLGAIFLFIFSLCFSSFSIPLLLSGSDKATPEIAIYDAIRVDGNWPRAVTLAILQTLLLLLLARFVPASAPASAPASSVGRPRPRARRPLPLLSARGLRFTVFVPSAILVVALLRALTLPTQWADAAALSLALGLATGIIQIMLSLCAVYLLPNQALDRFLTGYLAPSPSILGFGLLMISVEGEWIAFLKLSFALTLVAFPLLYRGLIRAELGALSEQTRVARYLGASHGKIAARITWPQAMPSILRAAGLAAVWGAGDFALSGILATAKLKTLPLMMTDLMAQYQWSQAQALLLPLIAVVTVLYAFFAGASRYVAN